MSPQDERNLELARRLYGGDESERASIAHNIVWHVPGHNPVSGDYDGYEAYTQLMPSRMAPLARWDFTLQDIMVNGDYVMTTFRLQGQRKDRSVDLTGGHVLRIVNGEVVEGWGFTTDQDALDEFFAA